jgi:hypothetical protein
MRIDWNRYDPADHFDELIAALGQALEASRRTYYARLQY